MISRTSSDSGGLRNVTLIGLRPTIKRFENQKQSSLLAGLRWINAEQHQQRDRRS